MPRIVTPTPVVAGNSRSRRHADAVRSSLQRWQRLVLLMLGGLMLLGASLAFMQAAHAQSSVRPPSSAQPSDPGPAATGAAIDNLSNSLGTSSDSDFWRKLREGQSGYTRDQGTAAGQAIRAPAGRLNTEAEIRAAKQSGGALSRVTSPNISGDGWRAIRSGPLPTYGAMAMGGIVVLLGLFFLLRGRIRVEHGMSGFTVTRFMTVERMAHWLLAVSFIILAITGLAITYGKDYLSPVLGKEFFATLLVAGKWMHNYVAFAFMVGLAMIFVFWIKDNLPSRTDINWILKGGGLFSKGVHPPAKRFNFGQKIIFWLVLLGGVSISMSGIALMFPYQTNMFSSTFEVINSVTGLGLATDLSLVQEQQLAALWHAIMAIFLVAVIIAHIYIGSIGMEGAFDAMGSGEVDVNWAKEHHSLWYEEVRENQVPKGDDARPAPLPAE
ncbi:MAG: formate dehydrogenase subunit gamma [Pseudomonadota bacterium]